MKIEEIVSDIKHTCLTKGRQGIIALTERFDGIKLDNLTYNIPENIKIDRLLAKSIQISADNIYKFHKAEHDKLLSFENDKIETSKDIICWRKFTPIQNIGIYIPSGLFSSALMNIIPAQITRCEKITICTPPNPSGEILFTLNSLGISQIYTIGGAQAIFAMAYGIGEVPKVDKIFGPGNEFVDMAKRMVSNEVAIDMPAGPSEVLVIADKNANKTAIMYDLLAQLEHGKESKAWLFCTSEEIIQFARGNINKIIEGSNRFNILKSSLQNLIIEKVDEIEVAIEKSNNIAPEHLILNISNPERYLDKIINAGSVFVGKNTPESLGDYLSGTNHVLPTSGFAKAFSGLSILSFGKFITFQTSTKDGLKNVLKNIKIMAESEKLEFHAKSINRE